MKGYVLAYIRIDGEEHNFANGKISKEKISQKKIAPVEVVERAEQIKRGGRIILKAKTRCSVDLIYGKNAVISKNYEGRHTIYVYPNRIVIK